MLFESENGWKLALWFSVVLNVNLAILNMLPIPVLDGGHIILALIEGVRRKPVSMKILEWVQTACATVIIGYMLYISFFDIGDLLGKSGDQKSSKKQVPAAEQSTPAP
jgi:regulator of sigma E protease